jgi:GMP synthase (glutamine-hydrolysing)
MVQTLKKVTDSVLAEIEEEMGIRQTREVFLLFTFGSQFDHLIAQRLAFLGFYCLVANPATVKLEDVSRLKPIGIILSGGPVSVHTDPPPFDGRILDLGIPVLGICLGFQLWAQHIGLQVEMAERREFGVHPLDLLETNSLLFKGIDNRRSIPVQESHGDRIVPSTRLQILASSENSPVAAAKHRHLYGVQFHPEVSDTIDGAKIFDNFCTVICGAKDRYPASGAAMKKITQLRDQIGDRKVVLALSGGSDSAVAAHLLGRALADSDQPQPQVRAVYIKGIDRPDDEANVLEYFSNLPWLELVVVDATERFLQVLSTPKLGFWGQLLRWLLRLKAPTSMRAKRVAMRSVYRAILEEQIEDFGADFIVQGTLYTDISESGGGYATDARKAQIKLHHNTNLDFSVRELMPLADCVKDNARDIGRAIGVPEALLVRHPFPGPGLVVRIEGEVTRENLAIARQLDDIYIAALRKWNLYDKVWQAGATVTQSIHTCTKGDDAASGVVVTLWAVWSVNGFTAQWAELPPDFLRVVSRQITNQVRQVGAVTYRISDKPPTTIEWG